MSIYLPRWVALFCCSSFLPYSITSAIAKRCWLGSVCFLNRVRWVPTWGLSSPVFYILRLSGSDIFRLFISMVAYKHTVFVFHEGLYSVSFLTDFLLFLTHQEQKRPILLGQLQILQLHAIELTLSHWRNGIQFLLQSLNLLHKLRPIDNYLILQNILLPMLVLQIPL